MESWARRRSEFNHDWLKTVYLNALGSFVMRLESGGSGSATKIEEFLSEEFPAWEGRSVEARELILGFEDQMTPARLFDRPPLIRCNDGTKAWLAPLVHQLWLGRYGVQKLVDGGLELLEKVDRLYRDLGTIISETSRGDMAALRESLPRWKEFLETCRRLSEHLSKFPNRIEVA